MRPADVVLLVLAALVVLGGGSAGCLYGCPKYNVWEQRLAGEAELAKAQQNRQVKISEAQAAEEAAKHLAGAEVERARGVAQANKIIGDSLKGNEAYLRYLWIQGLHDNAEHGNTIYVPTEAGLPILEAGRVVAEEGQRAATPKK